MTDTQLGHSLSSTCAFYKENENDFRIQKLHHEDIVKHILASFLEPNRSFKIAADSQLGYAFSSTCDCYKERENE